MADEKDQAPSISDLMKEDWSKGDSVFLSEVLEKYYRQPLPYDLEVYKNPDTQAIGVRQAIHADAFYQKVGRSSHVLDFSETERMKFAGEASVEMIAVFLLFEKQPEVLEVVLNNPRLPTKVLLDFVNLIKERDIDRQDDKILRLSQKILGRRSRRIVKAREILTISKSAINQDRMLSLISFAMDEDPLIRKAALNVLQSVHSVFVKEMLDLDTLVDKIRIRVPEADGIDVFSTLHAAVHEVLRGLELNQMLGGVDRTDPTGAQVSLRNSLRKRKLWELDKCKEDPTDPFRLTLLAYFHLDRDTSIREKAAEILRVDDILDVVDDESVPRRLVQKILTTLEAHTDEKTREMVREARIKEVERLNKRLREIEVSVNAYFDVIFQSLGYNRINDKKDAIQALKNASMILQQYAVESKTDTTQNRGVLDYLNKATQYFESTINALYMDTKHGLFSELDEIKSMVHYVLDLKHFRFQDEKQKESDIDDSLLQKAVMIWRTAISQYLGRIKDLEEMLHMKWIKWLQENEPTKKPELMEDELHGAFLEIEIMHKKEVDCKLRIPCRECKRRGCASERFLLQVDFMLEEILSNFESKEPA